MYEVIVVDDASADDTAQVLQQLEQRYDHLWSVHISPETPGMFKGKKSALAEGLKYAKNNVLLLTDADCLPAGTDWLRNMVAPIAYGKQIVIGYGAYKKGPGLLNAWTRWETMHSFLQAATYALAGKPYMAVGRNMACTKDVLAKVQSSDLWNVLPSGDDDLLMALAATKDNTAVVCNEASFTTTATKETWSGWLRQKQRHMSTGKYYKTGIKLFLGTYALSHALIWLLFFVLLVIGNWKIPLLLMALRSVLYWYYMARTSRKLSEQLLFSLPSFDLGWMLYNFVLSPYIIFKNKKAWT